MAKGILSNKKGTLSWTSKPYLSHIIVMERKSFLSHIGKFVIKSGKTCLKPFKNCAKYPLHALAIVILPMAYSSIKIHPTSQAINSPIVTYVYVYAEPAMGIIAAISE